VAAGGSGWRGTFRATSGTSFLCAHGQKLRANKIPSEISFQVHIKLRTNKMSSQLQPQNRRKSVSPTDVTDDQTWTQSNTRAQWNSPVIQPLPKGVPVTKTKHEVKAESTNSSRLFGDIDEDQAFEKYTKYWAAEDREAWFKKEQLEDIEETMEAVMQVAHKVSMLAAKLKRNVKGSF
jgi:hypothetical protein